MDMHKNILFVDYENVGKVDLNAIPEDFLVPFFFGASQKSVPTDFMRGALKLGDRFIPIDVEGQGKNALDFHIAFYLGEHLSKSPQTSCIILSKDKGFDPLVKHLTARQFNVRRVTTLRRRFRPPKPVRAAVSPTAPTPASKQAEQSPLEAGIALLKKMQPRARPRKRKGLIAHLNAHFRKKLPESELTELVEELIAAKNLSEVDGKLAYHL